jgi:hypothetical protein
MEIAVRHVETDPLEALRAELVGAARRGTARRRRRRRSAAVALATLTLLAVAAGAAAVTKFSTGVPAVDELLQVERGDGRGGPVVIGAASEPLPMDLGRAGKFQLVAVLLPNGNICTASADFHRTGVRGGVGCAGSVARVNRRVGRRGGTWAGSSIGFDSRVNQFLVDADVDSVRPLGEGDWTVSMTPPWTPEAPGARPLRLVLVTDDADIGDPGGTDLPAEAHTPPALELTYSDGRETVLEGF